jgi:hypothetical protein
MLLSWQLLYPNKSLQAFFLPEIDVIFHKSPTPKTFDTYDSYSTSLQQIM